MFSSYSDAIQTILAILATFISVMEWVRYRNEKNEIKEKTKTEKQLVETVKNIDVDAFKKNIDGLKIGDDLILKVKKALEAYDDIFDKTIILYKQLLKDESTFSLSYGFDRYINQFRELCIQGKSLRDELSDSKNDAMQQLGVYLERGSNEISEEKFNGFNNAINDLIREARALNWTDYHVESYLLNEMKENRMNLEAAKIVKKAYECFIDIDEKLIRMGEIIDGTKEMIEEIIIKYGD